MALNEQMLTPVQGAHTNPTLEFRDGQLLLRMLQQNGAVHERLISYESAREAFTNVPVDSGWLAPEVARWGTGRNGDWAVIFVPPGRHTIEITSGVPGPDETTERVTTLLPGMVMFGIAVKYWVWAVRTDRLDPYQEIYRAPLPNVMADAEVCWGLLKAPRCSARTILKAWEMFLTSTFNNHAASGKSKRNREDVRETLRGLAAEGEVARYPGEDLARQTEQGVSLDRALRVFFETGAMPQ